MQLTSIADARPRNIESVRTQDLIPPAIQNNAKNFIALLEKYYDYMNSEGLPSSEIQSLSSNKDIDKISDKYLIQIEQLIGKAIPKSQVLSRLELYKIIIQYYNTRGSEDSIHLFFRIFLNKIVQVSYPKEQLFTLSDGRGEWVNGEYVYSDFKSFPSHDYKLFDGYYYQDYSYVIRSDIDSLLWQDDYIKFVHPAGLKLFTAIVIEIVKKNFWNNQIDYSTTNIDDNAWLTSLVPPFIRDRRNEGYHTPKYQPGYLRDSFLRYIFTYLFDPKDEDLLRAVYVNLAYYTSTTRFRDTFIRERYQVNEKFVDPTEIGAGFLNKVIGDGDETYSRTNRFKMLNFGAFISNVETTKPSYFDTENIGYQEDWESSYIDTEQSTLSEWELSYYE